MGFLKRLVRWLEVAGRRLPPPREWLLKNTFILGAARVPNKLAEFDVIISGGKGVGKTTAFVALMLSRIDGLIASGKPFNVHAFTPKPDDFLPLLKARYEPLGISVRSTNPFIRDSWAWDGAMNLTDPPKVDEMAVTAIPDSPNEHNPFFTKTAQLVLRGVILSLATTHPMVWRMRHVVHCIKDRRILKRVLGRCAHTRHILGLLSGEQGITAANIAPSWSL